MSDPAPLSRPVHDPRILRAIAHPVRNRILEELGATGPMRAADVARELGVPANQASFHLRQLAKYGLVEEAPEEARDGRDRVWRSSHEAGYNIDTKALAQSPGGAAAVKVFRRSWSEAAHEAVRRAEVVERDEATMAMVSEAALRLTRAEAVAFAAELNRLTEQWRRRGREARETREPGADVRTYQLLQILQPAAELTGAPDR